MLNVFISRTAKNHKSSRSAERKRKKPSKSRITTAMKMKCVKDVMYG